MSATFLHSPLHQAALQLVQRLAKSPNEADENKIVGEHYDELGAWLSRDDYRFVRDADAAERHLAKRLLRRVTAPAVKRVPRAPWFGQFGRARLNQFRQEGCIEFGRFITAESCNRIVNALSGVPVYNAHIAGVSDGVPRRIGDANDPAERFQFGSYEEEFIASLSDVHEIVRDNMVIRFLAAFFGTPPVLRDLHLWWSFPDCDRFGPQPHAGQQFHRDYRALQDVHFFVCLNDMPGEDGAHHYLCETHDETVFTEKTGERDPEILRAIFHPTGDGYGRDERWIDTIRHQRIIPIRRGHAFAIDSMGLHRGIPPTKAPRLVMSARFSASGAEATLVEAKKSGRRFPFQEFVFRSYARKIGTNNLSRVQPAADLPSDSRLV